MDKPMRAGMQTLQRTPNVRRTSERQGAIPDALDILERLGSAVTIRRSCEIYGQRPADGVLLVDRFRLRPHRVVDGRRATAGQRIPVAGRRTRRGRSGRVCFRC